MRVLRFGRDTERFRPACRRPEVRQTLGWGERPVVLTVGRLQKRKGHDQLSLATTKIRTHVPDVLYAIAGDGAERKALEDLVARGRLEEHVRFHADISDDQLVDCYQQCDSFALPNRQVGRDIEGFGMVLLEGQAWGKPVVAGTSGGTAETMRIPETGRIVNRDSPDELAGVVRMGAAGGKWVVETCDWEKLSRPAELLFDSVNRSRNSRAMADAAQ